jgi:hypothetical protein
LLAVAAAVGVAAGFAALTATAWAVALPIGARADVASSAADSVVISKWVPGNVGVAQLDSFLRQAVSADAPGLFAVSRVLNSSPYRLPGSTGDVVEQIYAVDTPSVRAHAVLAAGVWPSTATDTRTAASARSLAACTTPLDISESLNTSMPPCTVVPAALPVTTADQLKLSVGDRLTVSFSPNYPPVSFLIVGEYRLRTTVADRAALAWDQTPAGVEFGSSVTVFGPLAVAPEALTAGALPIDTAQWTLIPRGAPPLSTLRAAIAAINADKRLSDKVFAANTALSDELSQVNQRSTAAEAQLLAAAILLGLLAGLAVAAAAGNLVGRGAAQAALMRSRGAPAWKLAAVYLPDVAVLFLAAAAGVLAQGPLLGRAVLRLAAPDAGPAGLPAPGLGLSSAGWVAGAAVAGVAAVIVLLRAARTALPAQVAAAAGRQAAVAGVVRAGADVALLGLAVVSLWQATNTGLAASGTNGGTGVVLITACAPALAAAAGAAVCGRLVTIAALLSERLGARARSLPARLAAWELARTPARHVVPALLAVAAVAGCGYTAAQHASWQRSAHDQADFQVGADVAVNLGRPVTLDEAGRLTSAAGVQDATPVYQSLPLTGPTVLGLDAASAAHTSLLRPDQTGGSPTALWASITPATRPGTALPGRPVRLELTAKLTAPGLTGTSVSATVADATGLTYSVDLGPLPADGVRHTVVGRLASDASGLDYPLRLLGVGLDYQLPQAPESLPVAFTVGGVAELQGGATAFTPVPGALAAIGSWMPRANWAPSGRSLGEAPVLGRRPTGADGSQTLHFASGDATHPARSTIFLTAGEEPVLPAVATSAYLKASHESIGSTVPVLVDQATIKLRIVGAVSAFPAVDGIADDQALITDLGALSDEMVVQDDPPTAVTWWLHTTDGAVPSALPVAAQAADARHIEAGLLADPMSAISQRVLEIGAVALVVLALLGLLISLLAAAREAGARDTVLSALGMTWRQRASLGCILHTAVALPAGILGVGLGLLLSRILVPVFVLSPQAAEPRPPAVVLFAAVWPVAAAAVLVGLTALAAFAASARRRDPSSTPRLGG